MNYTTEQASLILQAMDTCMREDIDPAYKLKKIWWTLLLTRSEALTNGLRPLTGDKVYSGPFKDMLLTNDAIQSSGCRSSILLGCYEQELHTLFEKIIATNYTRVLNIGCSVGYYAVGLARRMPHTMIEAFDIDPNARRKCTELAKINGVSDRINVSGKFSGDDFAKYTEGRTLVLMDIEGAETQLLDPVRYPALQKMDVVVELHDILNPVISKEVSTRFIPTHHVEIIKNQNFLPDLGTLLPQTYHLDPFDHLLLGWEARDGATPWGVFSSKE